MALTRSTRFDQALRNEIAAQWTVQVNAYRGGAQRAANVPFEGGTITFDLTASSRRTLSGLVVVDDGTGNWVPKRATHFLSAFGNELEVLGGFDYLDGSAPELLPLGWFVIRTSNPDDYGRTEIGGPDISDQISAAGLEHPYAVANGTGRPDAIRTVVEMAYPGLTVSVVGLASPMPLTILEEGDRTDIFRSVSDWAQEEGCEAFIDERKRLIVRPRPDPTAQPAVVDFDERVAGAPLSHISRAQDSSRDKIHNVWQVRGEGNNAGVFSGSAEITDPNSPIHPGVIGRRPAFVSSPKVTSNGGAQAMADGLRTRGGTTTAAVTITGAPLPWLVPGDVAHAYSSVLGLDSNVVLARWDLSLQLPTETTYETLGAAV